MEYINCKRKSDGKEFLALEIATTLELWYVIAENSVSLEVLDPESFAEQFDILSEPKVEKKLPSKVIVDFSYEYHKGRTTTYKHLRFGQAFLNKFYPDLSYPELYYEIDEQKAANLIVSRFAEIDSETLSDILWRM